MHTHALVLFSGGQDSATALAWALDRYTWVETIGFDYGQRHRVELECRTQFLRKLRADCPHWSARLGDDHLLDLGLLGQVSDTALTAERAIAFEQGGLPNTFVPGRNLIFFTFAAAVGYRRGLSVLVGGMCETDYSGYPDCRDDSMKALQIALSLGMDQRFRIDTPLMWIDKAQTWQMAHDEGQASGTPNGGDVLIGLIQEHTHTCYLGDRTHRHDWGYGCGQCPACELRAQGWQRWRA